MRAGNNWHTQFAKIAEDDHSGDTTREDDGEVRTIAVET
jgi:hypothetical protein